MILKDWLELNNIRPYIMAAKIGVGQATLYKSLSGSCHMSAQTAVKIEEHTNGEVSRTEAIWPEMNL